jgi:hypothetical protein
MTHPKVKRVSKTKKLSKKQVVQHKTKTIIKRRIRQRQPVHKRILLNPLSVITLLCVTVFVVAWTYKATAASYNLTVEVPAAALTEPAVITSPVNGQTFSQTPINVSGTCPYDSYVTLHDNNLFSGVAWCSQTGNFQIQTSLFNGANDLTASDYNITNEEGPSTSSVTVNLEIPQNSSPTNTTNPTSATGSSGSSTTNSESSNTPPLVLVTNYTFQMYKTNSMLTWQLKLTGGTPPYAVLVDWGNGKTTNYVIGTGPTFVIHNTYTKQGYYVIKIYVTDAKANKRMLQLVALVNTPGPTGMFTTLGNAIAPPTAKSGISKLFSSTKGWLWLAWPSLIVVMLMLFSFWLGERQELRRLLAKKRLTYR